MSCAIALVGTRCRFYLIIPALKRKGRELQHSRDSFQHGPQCESLRRNQLCNFKPAKFVRYKEGLNLNIKPSSTKEMYEGQEHL